LRKLDGFLDRLPRLAGQPEDKGSMDRDAELAAVLGETARDVGAQAFLYDAQDLKKWLPTAIPPLRSAKAKLKVRAQDHGECFDPRGSFAPRRSSVETTSPSLIW